MNINLTDEALFTAIWGSGASYTYSWYLDTTLDEDNQRWTVVLDNGEGGRESATLTPGTIRRAIEAILDDKPEYTGGVQHLDWSDPEIDSEVDADIADTVVQYAVLGKVVFG